MIFGMSTHWMTLSPIPKKKSSPIEIRGKNSFFSFFEISEKIEINQKNQNIWSRLMIFGTSTRWLIFFPPLKKKRSPIEIRGQFNFLYLKLFI